MRYKNDLIYIITSMKKKYYKKPFNNNINIIKRMEDILVSVIRSGSIPKQLIWVFHRNKHEDHNMDGFS